MIPPAIFAQEHGLGLVMNDSAYQEQPIQVQLLSRDYQALPAAASLKKYCPTPGNQGRYGTCVAWITAYGACSIIAAQANGWANNPQKIAAEAFSPGFLYYHIKNKSDYNCEHGAQIEDALSQILNLGIAKKYAFDIDCATKIPQVIYDNAIKYNIKTYNRLFNTNDAKTNKLQSTKKALAEGHPVLIGMNLPNSFSHATEYWKPVNNDNPNTQYDGHAMCVIGYDDARQAFEFLNSWGTTEWGNGGFTWVRYDDFYKYVKYFFSFVK